MLLDKAIQYANDIISGEEVSTVEVKKQCKLFLNDYTARQYNDNFDYYFDEKSISKIEKILKLMNFATGVGGIIGKNIVDGLWGFQAFFFINLFGWRMKEHNNRFRYKDVTLFIPRKSSKTFIVAVVLLIGMLTEDNFSEFYSICKDRELAAEVKKAMTQIINASPALTKYFKLSKTLSGKIECKITDCYYQARTADPNANNSIRPAFLCADEIGAFKTYANITAMTSGMLSVNNPIILKITTAYAENESIMFQELEYIRNVYDGVIEDERMFALLYYAEEEHKWDDIGLMQSNPLRIEQNYDEIKEKRKKALAKPLERTEYLTKHMNIFVQENADDKYIDIKAWKKCGVDKIDFTGKEVTVAMDLSVSTDITAVSIGYKEDGKYYYQSIGFLPRDNLADRREKIDYLQMERLGFCKINDGLTVSYNAVEEYIRAIEDKYGCKIINIITDPYNAMQLVENLSNDFDITLLKQTYTNLSPATKDFRKEVYEGNIIYEKNQLLDWNVSCASTTKGKSDDEMLIKENKNKQRIDMLAVLVFIHTQIYMEIDKAPKLTTDYLKDWFSV